MDFSIFIPTIEIGPPFTGPMAGVRRYTYSLVHSLCNQKVDIHIATTSEPHEDSIMLDRENVHFHKLPPQISARGMYSTQTNFYAKNHRRFSRQAFGVFKELSNEHDFDLIHSTEVSAYYFAKAKKRKEIDIPLIISVHGAVTTGTIKSRMFVKRPYARLLRKVIDYSDFVVTNSESLLEKVKRLPKGSKEKVSIIPNSLNCKKFSQIPKIEDIEHFRDKYDLDQKKTIVLMQGPFITRKTQHEIIDYFPKILQKQKDIMFLIIGEGPLLPKIKEKIIDLDIEESVRIAGYINEDELILAYHTSDILLYPTREGSLGTPLIEAMAAGLPVVAADKPPMNEMLPPKSGWLYPSNKEDILVAKIYEIVKNKEASQEITFKSQNHALKNYDYPVVGKKIIKLYEKILKQK